MSTDIFIRSHLSNLVLTLHTKLLPNKWREVRR